MKNSPVFDLVVIGNGIAARSFFWNLSNKNSSVSKCQNFSIAHIYSDHLTPPCSIRSSATVSLNGIDEDVSPLGNDMREAFFLFEEMFKTHHPEGVEVVTRTVVSTNENDTKKLTRRYKTLSKITHPKILPVLDGTEYDSYIITPEIFLNWMSADSTVEKTEIKMFVKNMDKKDENYLLTLENGETLETKKVIFATGAYSKIFEKFYQEVESESLEFKNAIKAGSYLERQINLGDKSFYLSIDGHQVLYRKNKHEMKLIIGSATTLGAYEMADLVGLQKLFLKLKNIVSFDLGEMSDYKIITGLRHKGPRRLAISEKMIATENLFRINGLYKNGYTLGLLAAKRMVEIID